MIDNYVELIVRTRQLIWESRALLENTRRLVEESYPELELIDKHKLANTRWNVGTAEDTMQGRESD